MKYKTNFQRFLYILSALLIIMSFISVVAFAAPINSNNELYNNFINIIFTVSASLSTYLLAPICVLLLIGTFFANIKRFGEFFFCYISMAISIVSFAGSWFYILRELAKGLENY